MPCVPSAYCFDRREATCPFSRRELRDHRIRYGADAAAFLQTIKSLLENPLRLAL
jgi:hypothetical protein